MNFFPHRKDSKSSVAYGLRVILYLVAVAGYFVAFGVSAHYDITIMSKNKPLILKVGKKLIPNKIELLCHPKFSKSIIVISSTRKWLFT